MALHEHATQAEEDVLTGITRDPKEMAAWLYTLLSKTERPGLIVEIAVFLWDLLTECDEKMLDRADERIEMFLRRILDEEFFVQDPGTLNCTSPMAYFKARAFEELKEETHV